MKDLAVPERKFRPELEGVRALAAFLVAIYHIWLGSVSGGVDVFFIVSGYLITTSLINRYERDGKIKIFEYVLGLLRRLLPIALTVIIFIILVSIFILPQSQWFQTIPHVFSSMFYYQNWQLANEAVDYLAQNNEASPFQHYWALSLQGQFYIIWPFVIYISTMLANKIFKTPIRKTLLSLLIILFVMSLIYSIYITIVNQPWAYFDTFARLWEFSLGGILALLLVYISINKFFSILLGWLGVIIIAITGLILPVSTLFPGIAALLPTFGVILVIISAENSPSFGASKLLSTKFFVFLGSVSYSYYLWHWPLLVFYLKYYQVETVSIIHGLIIMIIAFVLSLITSRMLENPIRKISIRTEKRKIVGILTVILIPTFISAFVWLGYSNELRESTLEVYSVKIEDYPGALSIYEEIEPKQGVDWIPSSVNAPSDTAHFYFDTECFTSIRESIPKICSYGNTEDPEYTIALVGGSHSGHWFTALEEIAVNLNLRLDTYIRDGCRFSDGNFDGLLNEQCMEWNDSILELLLESQPDIIFTTATVFGSKNIPDEYISVWEKLENSSIILAVRDNPRMKESIPTCLDTKSVEECSVPTKDILASDFLKDEPNIPNHVIIADLSKYFCDEEFCKPVIGNVIVYRDKHHLTATYVKTLVKPLEEHVKKALGTLERE